MYSCSINCDVTVRHSIAYNELEKVWEDAMTTCFTKISCILSLVTAGIPITDQILLHPPLFHNILSYAKAVCRPHYNINMRNGYWSMEQTARAGQGCLFSTYFELFPSGGGGGGEVC